jgi:hypothetical protein
MTIFHKMVRKYRMSTSSFFVLLIPVAATLLLISCERDIDIDLPIDQNLIVIEGHIENGSAPRVLVTRNRGFFDEFPANLEDFIEQFVIQDAQVNISDGIKTVQLQFVIDPFNYPFVYYTSQDIKGEAGKTYTLSILAEGRSINAVTTIPEPVALDSIYFKLNIFDKDEDSLGFVFARLSDPDTLGNGYRVYSKRNSETGYFPVQGSAFNDEFINGLTIEFFNQQSEKPFSQDSFIREDFYYSLGDTAYMKFCSIGWKEVEFFRTYEAARSSNGNPFSAPTLIKSNVNGGLGIWFGIGASYDTLIIK